MNKNEFIGVIAQKLGYSRTESERALDVILESIIDAVAEHGKLKFVNFGVFTVKERKARIGCNPKTQEKVEIPEKRVVKFVVGKMFSNIVEGEK